MTEYSPIAQDTVAVITGAAGGIGLGIAKACIARGMRVVIADIDGARAAEAADFAEAGDNSRIIATGCDVRKLQDVERLRDVTLDTFRRIDLVCNNAGIGLTRAVADTSASDWDLVLDVNLRGVVNGVQTFLPVLRDQGFGHLSATASLSGLIADPLLAAYNASKFAVVGVMESIALELAAAGESVTCSVLCPGPVATDLIASSNKQLADAGSADAADSVEAQAVGEYLAAGMHPDQVGSFVVEAISRGDFWLLTHPEDTLSVMEPRFESQKQGKLYLAEDWLEQR